ncbi:hypothetical protein BofuT4_P039500.1 [Botrytis cinerea T4]|uniref:Uncharacterized protein n=1 Tax=Botryotinia fuckeliana (strain T4) TaxID=999810 RepID=G2Y308_BOTF4|nr:hypothetical protein BofuT4_P039500.1 [Botrytis cinerea T4]
MVGSSENSTFHFSTPYYLQRPFFSICTRQFLSKTDFKASVNSDPSAKIRSLFLESDLRACICLYNHDSANEPAAAIFSGILIDSASNMALTGVAIFKEAG